MKGWKPWPQLPRGGTRPRVVPAVGAPTERPSVGMEQRRAAFHSSHAAHARPAAALAGSPTEGGHTPAEPAAGSGFQVATKAGKGVGWTVTGCRWGTHTSALCNTCGFGQAQVLHQLSPHRWLLLRPSARCFSRRDTQPGAAPESPAALLRIAPR